MKHLLLYVSVLLLLAGCTDASLPRVNGFWQLKSIEIEADGTVLPIDTVFFGFQRQKVFSYTVVKEVPTHDEPIYGYVSFPSDKQLTIEIHKPQQIESYLNLLIWKKAVATFDILELTSRRIVLRHEGITYNLVNY